MDVAPPAASGVEKDARLPAESQHEGVEQVTRASVSSEEEVGSSEGDEDKSTVFASSRLEAEVTDLSVT